MKCGKDTYFNGLRGKVASFQVFQNFVFIDSFLIEKILIIKIQNSFIKELSKTQTNVLYFKTKL